MVSAVRFLARVAAVAVPVALGVMAVAWSENLKQPPAGAERQKKPTPVRVLTLAPVEMVPRVSGYGTVTPARSWRAVARIEGEVAETHPQLASGEIVPAGTLLMRIDDTDLKLSLAQIAAQSGALDVKDETLRASLEIAEADLALSRAELARQEELAQRGTATQAALDQAKRQELAARADVTDLQNDLSLAGAEHAVLAAQKASAERALIYTEVHAPYDLRIGTVSAEVGQVVSQGQVLFTGDGIEAAEVEAQFPIGRIGPLVRMLGEDQVVTDLKARVRLTTAGHDVVWAARVTGVADAIDTLTQSSAVRVRVDDPQSQAQAGQRPPLRRNMFVEVILAAPKRNVLLAPLDAVRGGKALVVSAENTLERREVTTGFVMGDLAMITGGLAEGDRLVVTDPSIAVPGMAVKPVEDKQLAKRLAKAAGGQGKGQ